MKYLIALLLMLSFSTAGAVDMGIVSANDTINIPVVCMDTLGRKAAPDSSQVFIWYHGEGANDYSYSSANSAGGASGAWLDSVRLYGFTSYHFIDQVSDLDSNYASGLFSGMVLLWKQGYPTYNPFSFSKTSNSADDIYPRIDATVSSRSSVDAIWDEAQSGHTSAGTFGKFLDTEITGRSNYDQLTDRVLIGSAEKADIADRVWDELAQDHTTDATFGDSLITLGKLISDASVPDSLLGIVPKVDTLINRQDSVRLALGWGGSSPTWDTLSTNLHDKVGLFSGANNSVKVWLDSLRLALGWGGSSPTWDTLSTNLHDKVGLFSGTNNSVKVWLDSLRLGLGWGGSSPTWYTLTANLNDIIGGYSGLAGVGGNVKDHIASLTISGGGTEPETLLVMSYNDSTLIQDARVRVKTIDQSTIKVPGLSTDVNGSRILELDPDSFFVSVNHNNYLMIQDTIVVESGGGTDTVWMSLFDPGNPADPDLCRVYGWVYDLTGDPLENIRVTSEIPTDYHPVKYSGAIVTPFKKSVSADSTGYWEIDLFPNSVLSNVNSKYLFIIENSAGIVLKTRVAVPDSASWQLR